MNPTGPHQWTTRSAEETEALGRQLVAEALDVSAACRVVELRGDLGSGKSTFARGVLRALGARGALKSPSYTLIEAYELPDVQVVHLDLYRLLDPEELEHLGLADYHQPGFLWLVEWPERGAGKLPAADLRFEFFVGELGHRIERIDTFTARK